MKALVAIGFVLAIVAFALAIGAGLGWLASIVLAHFGVKAPWYICWAAIVVFGAVLRPRGSS